MLEAQQPPMMCHRCGSTRRYVLSSDLELGAGRGRAVAQQASSGECARLTPHINPTSSNHPPSPTGRISPKIDRNIEHWWYDRSPANWSTTIPRSPAITQDIYEWFQGSHSVRRHSSLKQTTFPARSSAGQSALQIRATPDVALMR